MPGRGTGNLVWRWPDAGWTAAGAAPAVAVIGTDHVAVGIALAIGLLPVGLMGVRPARRQRLGSAVIGTAFASMLLVGSLVSRAAVVAVAAMFALPLLTTLSRVRPALRQLALALFIPGVAIGLSFGAFGDALRLASAIAAGVLWMVALSLLLPAREPPPSPPPTGHVETERMRSWGLMVGLAAGTATAVGEILGVAHIGWAPTAALLVMRPDPDLLRRRGFGRVIATVIGAVGAAACVELAPRPVLLAFVVGIVVVATVATRTSRWYVTSGGSSFLVLTLLLYGASGSIVSSTFWTRVGAALLGVALAYAFGVAGPRAVAATAITSPG